VDLATERRAPPPPARCQEEELFEDVMMRVLRQNRNPFI
jgi:hypothetical protein